MAGFPPKKNTAFTFYTALVSQADTDIFKTSPTLAAGDITVSIDGGNFANITTLPTQVQSTGVLPVALTAGEMNGDVIIVKFVDASGAEWQDQLVTIMTDTKLVSDAVTLAATQGTITWAAQTIETNVEAGYALSIIGSNGTGAQGLRIEGYNYGVTVVTEAPGAGILVDGVDVGIKLDATTPITPVLATPTNITAGTITTATSVTNGVTLADDAITAGKFDQSTAFPIVKADSIPNATAGGAGGLAIVGSAMATPTDQAVNVTKISGAAVNAALAQLGVNVVTQDNIDFGALQKSSLNAATPASVVGAVGSVAGNVVGSVGSLATQAKADVNGEVVDALRTDTIPDSVAADGAMPTIAQALYAILQILTEKLAVGATLTIYKPDGVTPLMTFLLNDANSPTGITRLT